MPIAPRMGDGAAAVLPFAPVPLQIIAKRRDFPTGETVRYFFITWDAVEANQCARCPASRCDRVDIPGYGTATCSPVLWGEESEDFAAELGVDL